MTKRYGFESIYRPVGSNAETESLADLAQRVDWLRLTPESSWRVNLFTKGELGRVGCATAFEVIKAERAILGRVRPSFVSPITVATQGIEVITTPNRKKMVVAVLEESEVLKQERKLAARVLRESGLRPSMGYKFNIILALVQRANLDNASEKNLKTLLNMRLPKRVELLPGQIKTFTPKDRL